MELARDQDGNPDIAEPGRGPDGAPIRSNRRLYMQLLAFGGCRDTKPVVDALREAGVKGTLYLDLNDPLGFAVVLASEEAAYFLDVARPLFQGAAFAALTPKPEYTMMGRTYSIGYEQDLDHVLVDRPLHRLTAPEWSWAVWYPLRRRGAFALLPEKEQREILAEHGMIGNAFGQAAFAHDIRLACHGLDKQDNDFVVGLVGKELHPLSAVVQTMRRTKQTSTYLERLGPFFIGRAAWRSA